MKETSKCFEMRKARGDFENYLTGDGIDIGAGDDPLQVWYGHTRPWDKADGDAQYMSGVADSSFDFVYSSHCLEHMVDVPVAIENWTRILRPRGHLYIVVPDYTLYEHHCWPSQYNADHKHSFSITIPRWKVGRDNHWSLGELDPLLTDNWLKIIDVRLEDNGYDYSKGGVDQTLEMALAQLCLILRKIP